MQLFSADAKIFVVVKFVLCFFNLMNTQFTL